MKCNFCDSLEELKWPENWKKGDRPVNSETGKTHICKKNDGRLYHALDAVLKFIITRTIRTTTPNPFVRSVF